MSMPQAGDLAPEVALPDEHGTVHRLRGRAGSWTVVYFYPKDDTPGCTTEACGFRDLHGELDSLDAQVWGISPDGAGVTARSAPSTASRSRSSRTRTTRPPRRGAHGARR